MKHRKSFLLSVLGIVIGIILWFSGAILNHIGIVHHYSGGAAGIYEYTTLYYLGIALGFAGVILIILGIFGLVITIIKEKRGQPFKQAAARR
jgi:hypothetical protein